MNQYSVIIQSDHFKKMVCVHRSGWAYRGTSLAALKAETSVYYDEIIKIINPKTQEKKTKLLKNKEEAIARFQKKAKQLSFFWDIPSLSWHLDPAMCEYIFTYFHPIVFIEQMNRIEEIRDDWTVDLRTGGNPWWVSCYSLNNSK